MTRDTILALSAGPETDLLVVQALGWSREADAYLLPASGESGVSQSIPVSDFYPSTDWRWAMLAVDYWTRPPAEDTSFVLHYEGEVRDADGTVVEPAHWFAFFPGPTEAAAETGPLAVCRSLLLSALHREALRSAAGKDATASSL
jgi:hypothetical protein